MKLVIEEPNSKLAKAVVNDFLRRGYGLCTVDIALAECMNALWKHATIHKDLKSEEAKRATQDVVRILSKLTVVSTSDLAEEAIEVALTQGTTVYDGLYVAAAQGLNARFLTADRRLHDAIKMKNKMLLKA